MQMYIQVSIQDSIKKRLETSYHFPGVNKHLTIPFSVTIDFRLLLNIFVSRFHNHT